MIVERWASIGMLALVEGCFSPNFQVPSTSNESSTGLESDGSDTATEAVGTDAGTSEPSTGADDDTSPGGSSGTGTSGTTANESSTGGSDTGDIEPGPACHPLLQNCADDQGCYPADDGFFCAPDASGQDGVYGDACELLNACDPGMFCAFADSVPGCVGAGCCSPFCDLTDPNASADCPGAPDQQCLAWYAEGQAPAGLESVGVCVIAV